MNRMRVSREVEKGSVLDFLKTRVIPIHHRGRPRKFWKELSPSESRVLRWLRAHADEHGRWIGSPSKIAPRARYSERTIRRAVRRLEELGLARRFKGNGILWGIVLQKPPSFSTPDNRTDKKLSSLPETGHETLQKNEGQNVRRTSLPPSFIPAGPKNTFQVQTFPPQVPVKPFEKTSPVSTPPSITVGGVPPNVIQRLVPERPPWDKRATHLYRDPATEKKYYKTADGRFALLN